MLCHSCLPHAVNEASATSSERPPMRDLQVLILAPDEKVGMEIVSALEEAAPGTRARVARSLGEAQRLVVDQRPALFVLDLDSTYEMGQDFIYDLRTSHPNARAIILTAIHFSAEREKISGLGAIHFLEKPFPRADFMTLVEALLTSDGEPERARFQGTLSDLHVADIIQLKCISGATSMLEFTGPRGEKARVYFEDGQVRHATASGKEGMAAFNEIVDWKGGKISEVPVSPGTPHTIDLDWQVLLMEAVRKIDESRCCAAEASSAAPGAETHRHQVLVIDDSAMLLSFVKEILEEHGCEVFTAETGEEGLRVCASAAPDLILLDFVLPDMTGDAVCRKLLADPEKAQIPVLYVSGFGTDLQADRNELPNLVGSLNKPFTSDALLQVIKKHLGDTLECQEPERAPPPREVRPPALVSRRSPPPPVASSLPSLGARNGPRPRDVVTTEAPTPPGQTMPPEPATPAEIAPPAAREAPLAQSNATVSEGWSKEEPMAKRGEAYFCGDSSFFSLHWALETIASENLTGILRAFWSQDSVELLAREGEVVAVTTRSPTLYCEEAPVTLLNVAREQVDAAWVRQREDGCPIFLTLAKEGLILREPGLQLVQHYGQKLFSRLWTERVRFTFEQHDLPGYAAELPSSQDEMDQWALNTLRFVQYQALDENAMMDASSIPAYTRDGYDRVQQLRLTVAEAQFASQFSGSRSIAQISKNLRLDIKFSRLTLFRFLALEIVECWPAKLAPKSRSRRRRRLFGR